MFGTHDWGDMYPDAQEDILDNTPRPLGANIQLNIFVDAANADDLVMRWSTMGIIVFANGTPIQWLSR
jgi:hypothetical protein